MNLEGCNPKEYTTEDLQDIKRDLRSLISMIDSELKGREQRRFEELVGDVLYSLNQLTKEFPSWATNFCLSLTGENWKRECMELSDFFWDNGG